MLSTLVFANETKISVAEDTLKGAKLLSLSSADQLIVVKPAGGKMQSLTIGDNYLDNDFTIVKILANKVELASARDLLTQFYIYPSSQGKPSRVQQVSKRKPKSAKPVLGIIEGLPK